ncbi:hypothetical protein EWM64_g8974 [Hericium alpestre]|uniref:Uncharacterized protein n=1 Tax=Hericium alpestre TaxID=135208 RepID=A0A4Y9ZNN3_9AGAM|nr:hypothetical protein EWM64_g8974 [Hericium alpestre]
MTEPLEDVNVCWRDSDGSGAFELGEGSNVPALVVVEAAVTDDDADGNIRVLAGVSASVEF